MRESSALESDANTILLIYRPADDSGRPTGEDEIIIAKQRHGPVGLESVFFDGRTMTFFERKTA
jgi:replicative DNA helicase